jgi:hypothetical protein
VFTARYGLSPYIEQITFRLYKVKWSFMLLIIYIRLPNVILSIDTYVKRAVNPNFICYIYNLIDSVVCGLMNGIFGSSDYAVLCH